MAMRATKIQSVKADAIGELKNKIGAAKDFIFAEYRGLTVEQISALRKQLREKNAEFHVVKNNFARIAFEDLGYTKEVEPVLAGPTAVAFSRSEANEVAKVLVDFAKETPALKVKAGIVDKGIHGRGRDRGLLEAPVQEPAHRDVHGGPQEPRAETRLHSRSRAGKAGSGFSININLRSKFLQQIIQGVLFSFLSIEDLSIWGSILTLLLD